MKDSHIQSIVKGITWRIIGTADTIFLSWLFTGSINDALKIGFIELFTKIVLYYFHERIWIVFHIGQSKLDSYFVNSKNETEHHYQDKHWKSLLKGISWRFFGTADTILISFFITHNYSKALNIGLAEVFTKVILYYLHERLWLKINLRKK